MSSEPRSGIGEYFAAIQARTLRRAIDAACRPSVTKMLANAQDQMWRNAAAKIRAEDQSARPASPASSPAMRSAPAPEPEAPKTRRSKRGPKHRFIENEKYNKKAIEEIKALLADGKSPEEIHAALGFPHDQNQTYLKKIRRLKRAHDERSP